MQNDELRRAQSDLLNGQEALDMAPLMTLDVVIMDLTMPVLDGVEATRLLRAASPKQAIIALSVDSELESAVLAAGASVFLAKGTSAEELLAAVRAVGRCLIPLPLAQNLLLPSQMAKVRAQAHARGARAQYASIAGQQEY